MSKDGYVRHDKTEYEVMLTSDVLENELMLWGESEPALLFPFCCSVDQLCLFRQTVLTAAGLDLQHLHEEHISVLSQTTLLDPRFCNLMTSQGDYCYSFGSLMDNLLYNRAKTHSNNNSAC